MIYIELINFLIEPVSLRPYPLLCTVGYVDNPELVVLLLTLKDIGDDDLENPDILPQENFPTGLATDPVVDNPDTFVFERILQVAIPVVELKACT